MKGDRCACGCGVLVTGKGRFATRACWGRTMNASWSAERKRARAVKAGNAGTPEFRRARGQHAAAMRWRVRMAPRLSATSRFL